MRISDWSSDVCSSDLQQVFGFDPPREHGFDTIGAIEAMLDGRGKVFFAMGGNFATATPDTEATHRALRNCELTVHVATKLNRSPLVHGRDRKSVVEGKRVSGRVDPGGGRNIKK